MVEKKKERIEKLIFINLLLYPYYIGSNFSLEYKINCFFYNCIRRRKKYHQVIN